MIGVNYTPLARISVPKGDVLHGLRAADASYHGFGEAYFSSIEQGAVKGWRRHTRMVLNLIVPSGAVRFVVCGEAEDGGVRSQAFDLAPTLNRYGRLTVQPNLWLAFQGLGSGTSLVLNIASIVHDPNESQVCALDALAWDWTVV